MENLPQQLAKEIRKQGIKCVKSIFWNSDSGNLSVFTSSHTPDVPKSFNYTPDPEETNEEIIEQIVSRCNNE